MEWALNDASGTDERREAILRVAGECFERFGVHRTRMEDIADAVGISRPMVYRYFATREQLIDAVILDQVRQLAETVGPIIVAFPTLAEAVVEGSVLLVEAARDARLEALVLNTKPAHLRDYFRPPWKLGVALAAQIWHPVLEQARLRGEVRQDLDEDSFTEWLSSLHLLFWLRRDLDYDHMRTLLNAFLVPALHPLAASLDTSGPRNSRRTAARRRTASRR